MCGRLCGPRTNPLRTASPMRPKGAHSPRPAAWPGRTRRRRHCHWTQRQRASGQETRKKGVGSLRFMGWIGCMEMLWAVREIWSGMEYSQTRTSKGSVGTDTDSHVLRGCSIGLLMVPTTSCFITWLDIRRVVVPVPHIVIRGILRFGSNGSG